MEISSKSKEATVPDHSVDEASGPRACESGFLAVDAVHGSLPAAGRHGGGRRLLRHEPASPEPVRGARPHAKGGGGDHLCMWLSPLRS